MNDLKIVPIGKPNLADIPAMLEHTAANIRAGVIEPCSQAVLVILVGEPGERSVAAYDFGGEGDGTMLSALGLLEAAKYKMLRAINS